MTRSAVWLFVAVLLSAPPLHAQPEPEPKDGKLTIPLTLSPAAAPKPASRYYLLPEYRDQRPGERVQGFLKCFMEQDLFFNAENTAKRDKWLAAPLADLPPDAVVMDGLAYDPPYARLMVFADQAARMNRTDWNEWFNVRHDGFYTLLPEVQRLRVLARAVTLRMRCEVKAREFVRAVESARTLFGMADALHLHPTLISNLIGTAVANQALNVLEEMIQQPGCPDLFWSFADLPVPLLPVRNGVTGERVFVVAQFEPLLKARRPLSDAEMNQHVRKIEEIAKINVGPGGSSETLIEKIFRSPTTRYTAWSRDADRVAAARQRLVEEGGFRADDVREFSPLQVIVTADLVRYEVLRDEMFKWVNLPPTQAAAMPEADKLPGSRPGDAVLGPMLLPSFGSVKRAEARLDQRVAYLRVIEAVRLYAHDHGGQLPAALDDIKLPLPPDPVSGKPFTYTLKDGTATLTGANPNPGSPAPNRVYELRLRK